MIETFCFFLLPLVKSIDYFSQWPLRSSRQSTNLSPDFLQEQFCNALERYNSGKRACWDLEETVAEVISLFEQPVADLV